MKDYIKNIEDGERRFFTEPVHFRKKEDGTEDSNVIEGYAAVFNKPSQNFGGWEERIEKGAFSEVLNDKNVVALFNHDMSLVLGRNGVNMTLEEDDHGLKYTVQLPETTFAKDTRTLIQSKIIDKSSFGFSVDKEEWRYAKTKDELSVRIVKKVRRLYDVSPVTLPAYNSTSVATRSFEANKPKGEGEGLTLELMEMKLKLNKTSL